MQVTLCFSEIIGCPSSVSILRLNKGGIMNMLTFNLNYHLYGFALCVLHSVFCALSPLATLNRYRSGFFVAGLFRAEIAKSLILPSLGSGYG